MSMMKSLSTVLLFLLVIIYLAGCGSGGGSTPSADNSLTSGGNVASTEGAAPIEGTAPTGGTAPKADVLLSWDPPQAEAVGIKVYYGTSPRTYTSSINAGLVSNYTVRGLASGSYYFAMTAYDAFGNESGFSSEVALTIL